MTFRFLGTLLALLILCLLAERLPQLRPRRTDRTINALLAAFLLYALTAVYSDPLRRLVTPEPGFIRTYNLYHYYLGAKYFDELRYIHLYSCTLLASHDDEPEVWPKDTPVRDLTTYKIVTQEELPRCPVEAFSAARWQQFRQDLHYLTAVRTPKQEMFNWTEAIADKGFNQTPFWIFTARIFTHLVPLTDGLASKILFNLDILLVFLSLVPVARAFGTRSALFAGIGIVTYFGAYSRLFGNFLQYTWLALLLCAISLWKLKRDVSSAGCLTLAGLLHGFPFLLASGLVARTAQRWLARRRTDDPERKERWRATSYLALLGGMTVSFAILCTPFVGLRAWLEFFRNITLHSRELVVEPFNIGLKNLIMTAGSEGLFPDAFSYSKNHPATRVAMAYFQEHHGVYALLAALGVVVFLLSVRWARSDTDTFPLSLLLLYLLLTLSPYYYLSLVLIFLLPARESVAAWAAQIGLLILLSYHMRAPFLSNYVSFRYGAHGPSEMLLAAYLVGVSVIYAIEARSRHRRATTLAFEGHTEA